MLVWFFEAGLFPVNSFMHASTHSADLDGAPTVCRLSAGYWGYRAGPGTHPAYGCDSATTQQMCK